MSLYIKEETKNGLFTYKYNNIYIYSKYDPLKEAKRFLSEQKIKKNIITLCGADYVNLELSKEQNVSLILSLEPIDFDNKSINKKIRFNNIKDLENFLWLKVEKGEIDIKEISLIVWMPLINSNKEFFLPIINKVTSIIRKIAMSFTTQKEFMFLELRNSVRNLFSLSELTVLENKKIDNELALIIASGASLSDHIDKIIKLKNKVTIFSLPSSLPFLQYTEIEPDYVIAVDPGYATLYHLAKYKKSIKLLTTLCINPSILKIKNLFPIFFNYSSDIENIVFKDLNIVNSPSEGSVIFNTINILEQLGYKKVIIVGLDFSFKDNQSHIKEGFFEKEFLAKSSYFQTIDYHIISTVAKKDKTKININNKTFITDVALKTYYEHFLEKRFNIELILFSDCYNPLSENIKKITFTEIEKFLPFKDKKELFTNKINLTFKMKEEIKGILPSLTKDHNKLKKFF